MHGINGCQTQLTSELSHHHCVNGHIKLLDQTSCNDWKHKQQDSFAYIPFCQCVFFHIISFSGLRNQNPTRLQVPSDHLSLPPDYALYTRPEGLHSYMHSE